MVEEKYFFILTLGSSPISQLSDTIDDDDRTAKELWVEIVKRYRTSNEQAIENMEQEIEYLRLAHGQS